MKITPAFFKIHANCWPCHPRLQSGRAEQEADMGKLQLMKATAAKGQCRRTVMYFLQWKIHSFIFSPRQLS